MLYVFSNFCLFYLIIYISMHLLFLRNSPRLVLEVCCLSSGCMGERWSTQDQHFISGHHSG